MVTPRGIEPNKAVIAKAEPDRELVPQTPVNTGIDDSVWFRFIPFRSAVSPPKGQQKGNREAFA